MGSLHIKNALEGNNIELVGVCELNDKKAKVSLSGAIVPIVKTLQHLTHYEPEGLIMSSTNLSHGPLLESTFELDIPFICEKSSSIQLLVPKTIAKEAIKKNIHVTMALNRWVREPYSQMRRAAETRAIGKIKTFIQVKSRKYNIMPNRYVVA